MLSVWLPSKHLLAGSGINVLKEIYFGAFVDTKQVNMLSTLTYTSAYGEFYGQKLSRVQGRLPWPLPSTLPIPDLVNIYKKIMGGTDLWDQLVAAYQTQVRTRRWQSRIIFHLLNGMVVNAHILYKQTYNLIRKDKYFSLKDFKAAIVQDWGTQRQVNFKLLPLLWL